MYGDKCVIKSGSYFFLFVFFFFFFFFGTAMLKRPITSYDESQGVTVPKTEEKNVLLCGYVDGIVELL